MRRRRGFFFSWKEKVSSIIRRILVKVLSYSGPYHSETLSLKKIISIFTENQTDFL